MSAKHRKRIREIEKAAGVEIMNVTMTGKGHIKLSFNGGHVIISGSPSCSFSAKHAAADIRRRCRGTSK